MQRALLATTLGILAMMPGCDAGLPNYDTVIDLRVLAMRSEPPAVLMNRSGPVDATFTPLVVDPRGGTLRYAYQFCPIQSDNGCLDFEAAVTRLPDAWRTALTQMRRITQEGEASLGSDDTSSAPSYVIPPFNLAQASTAIFGSNITAPLFDFYAAQNYLDLLSGAWPQVTLTLTSSHGETLRASKRMLVGLADWQVARLPLAQLGIAICDVAPGPECLQLTPQSANTNPGLEGVLIRRDTSGTFEAVDATTTLRPNERVILRPSFADAPPEAYVILRADIQSRTVEPQTITEDFSVSWFCDAGTLLNALTWPKFTQTRDNVYTAPASVPVGGAVNLYVVARDHRGGTDWRSLRLQVASQ